MCAIAGHLKIFFFDEATRAHDNITQKVVSESRDILQIMRIVIAYRLSTIKSCNRILVLDGSRITKGGTYDKLISMCGLFGSLVKRQ